MAMTVIAVAAPDDRFKGSSFDGYDKTCLVQLCDQSRFKGGCHDGYDRNCFLQTHDRARFKGASYDGYDMNRGYNLPVAVYGITFIFY